MAADLRPLISDLASRADDYLAGVSDRARARELIADELAVECPQLDAAARQQVIAAVITVLEHEDFFGTEYVGDAMADDDAAEEA
jgi:hypothetical protein